jgi:hypothetical protein
MQEFDQINRGTQRKLKHAYSVSTVAGSPKETDLVRDSIHNYESREPQLRDKIRSLS